MPGDCLNLLTLDVVSSYDVIQAAQVQPTAPIPSKLACILTIKRRERSSPASSPQRLTGSPMSKKLRRARTFTEAKEFRVESSDRDVPVLRRS